MAMSFADIIKRNLGDKLTAEEVAALDEAIGKVAIPEGRFSTVTNERNTLRDTVNDLEGQLSTLKKSNKDNEGLQSQLATLKAERDAAEAKRSADQTRFEVGLAAKDAGAHNVDAVLGMPDVKKFTETANRDADGRIVGLNEFMSTFKANEGTAFLFQSDSAAAPTAAPPAITGIAPVQGADPGVQEPGQRDYAAELAQARENKSPDSMAAQISIIRDASEAGIYLA